MTSRLRGVSPLEGWLWLVSKVVEKVVVSVAELSVGETLSAMFGNQSSNSTRALLTARAVLLPGRPAELCDHV